MWKAYRYDDQGSAHDDNNHSLAVREFGGGRRVGAD
jgi:hypothetical protein